MLDPAEQWLVTQLRFDQAADRVLPPPLEWDDVVDAAQRHHLASIFLSHCRATVDLPSPARAELEKARYKILVDNTLHLKELTRWLDRLDTARIPVLALKGPALMATVYGELSLRPMTDIDVLVSANDFVRVGAMLRADGFSPLRDLGGGRDPTRRTQTIWWRAAPLPAAIHLHWHLIDSGYYARHLPIEWFWNRTQSVFLGERALRVFTPEAQLLYLSAHLQLHHHGASLLRLYDVAALIEKVGNSIDWNIILDTAERFEWSISVRRTLGSAQDLFGARVPAAMNARLARTGSPLHERITLLLAEEEVHPAAFLFDGWAQPGWRRKIDFWRRSIFPSEDFMMERHPARGNLGLSMQYFFRLGRGWIRVPRALIAGLALLLRRTLPSPEDRFSERERT